MLRAPWWCLLFAVAIRLLVACRTEVPGRDGVAYLWMAERAAAGELSALFATVFHPLYPALVAALLWAMPGLEPVVAGQLVASAAGAVAVVPLWYAARGVFGAPTATVAALAYGGGAWFARHPAECMSEGPFYLAVTVWARALAPERRGAVVAGVAGGCAFLLRPEGLALVLVGVVAFARARQFGRGVALAAVALPIVLLLPCGFWWFGHGMTLTPKAAFNLAVGVGNAASPVLHYLGEALGLPMAAAEELGWLWWPLAIVGFVRHRRARSHPGNVGGPAVGYLVAPFALQCLVVPLLHAHWRFLSGFGVLLLPFAGSAAVDVYRWLRARGRTSAWCFVVVMAAAEGRVGGARNRGAAIERELGRALARNLQPGEFVVSDMPRLDYFAGQQPPPPRPILPSEILRRARDPQCRFAALVVGRTELTEADLREAGLEPAARSPLLSATAARRIRLFERPRTR